MLDAITDDRPDLQYQEYTVVMADAQNERTSKGERRRSRRAQRGKSELPSIGGQNPVSIKYPKATPFQTPGDIVTSLVQEAPAFARPADSAAPSERMEVYCVHHVALLPEHEPINFRTNMTALRHLAVDRFGEARLFCDCLHIGPHQWPPSLQRLETAIELDQFLTDSTSDA